MDKINGNDFQPEDIANMTPEEISQYFDEIILLPKDNIISALATGKGCHNPPRC